MPLSLNSPPLTRAVLLRSTVLNDPQLRMNISTISTAWCTVVDLLVHDGYSRIDFTNLGKRDEMRLWVRPSQSQYMNEGMNAPRWMLKHLRTAGDIEWRMTPLSTRHTAREIVRKFRFTRVTIRVPAPPIGAELSELQLLRSHYLSNRTLIS